MRPTVTPFASLTLKYRPRMTRARTSQLRPAREPRAGPRELSLGHLSSSSPGCLFPWRRLLLALRSHFASLSHCGQWLRVETLKSARAEVFIPWIVTSTINQALYFPSVTHRSLVACFLGFYCYILSCFFGWCVLRGLKLSSSLGLSFPDEPQRPMMRGRG